MATQNKEKINNINATNDINILLREEALSQIRELTEQLGKLEGGNENIKCVLELCEILRVYDLFSAEFITIGVVLLIITAWILCRKLFTLTYYSLLWKKSTIKRK